MQIPFERHTLANGLSVLAHHDPTTPMVCVNLMYLVGSRNEQARRTGFAHLFEHLMFGGSVNIPQYDRHVESIGGENNAFTSADVTNYYLIVPAPALETALWLESDRMLGLAFSEEVLQVQKSVVIEEFKQRYLNQPYGDAWLLLRPLAYQAHPYRWPTIGMETSHIESTSMAEVMDFFYHYYQPGNAVLTVAGNVDPEHVFRRAAHWFSDIPGKDRPSRTWPDEPEQTEERRLAVTRKVPANAIYRGYHMAGRHDASFHAADLLSDILSGGFSSRFYQRLVKERALFSDLSTFVTGDLDPGLFVIAGRISDGIPTEIAEQAIDLELQEITRAGVGARELEKVKNKVESMLLFSALNLAEKAMNLAYHELTDRAETLNQQMDKYRAVTAEEIISLAGNIFQNRNSSTLIYHIEDEMQP